MELLSGFKEYLEHNNSYSTPNVFKQWYNQGTYTRKVTIYNCGILIGRVISQNLDTHNMLNSTSRRNLSAKQFVDRINGADAAIEANLSTVLQSVRGTKQFWSIKK